MFTEGVPGIYRNKWAIAEGINPFAWCVNELPGLTSGTVGHRCGSGGISFAA